MGLGILTRYIRLLAAWRATWLGKRVRELFAPGASLLNVGAGDGMLENSLARDGFSIISLEPGATPIKNAIKEPFESAVFSTRFDGIIFSYSLHHTANPGENIRKALTLLAPGGKMLILEIATKNAFWRWLTYRNKLLCWSHTHDWTKGELKELIESSGGTITRRISYRINAELFIIEAPHA